ncbi:peptidase M20 [Virgibacillus profundi]|uniref:Peptidase M20 n=1 Tax=Virgibacillus profundi TaxID=2024555 RepID=A0A2A2IDU0_9BACI|nr:M20 family metallopeptidase [Virgibacillus profundi]PAV29290.1 peptidase M20 [Virgibacillus profundi]PXY53459.1 amidohydrolase [Virgibacillus profundi]
MLKNIHKSIDSLYPEMVEIRRYLHQYPEVSFKEYKTAKYIADFYETLGIPYKTKVGGNGVIATLTGGKPGKTVALRADFDALPIQDEKKVPYKSKVDGVMHACGHDGHTATLLTLAKVMKEYQEELPGTIEFLHQHAEEYSPGGAKPIVESGAIDHVDAVFGTHLWATTPVGVLQTSKNVFMAGADRFEITIQGQGGHGAYPHETKDAIVIGSEVISQLQHIVSRRLDPLETAVVTVGMFEAGNSFNIIADKAKLTGTVRYLNPDIQEKVIMEMERIIKGICISNDASYTFNYTKGYPPLVNHEKEAELVLEASKNVKEIHKHEEVIPVMGGEDFAYYTLKKPGAYFFTGAEKEGNPYPHHHPMFDIDERALPIAAKTLIEAYFAYQD